MHFPDTYILRLFISCHYNMYRSQWPFGLMRTSEATWLLGWRVRISLRSWMCLLCVVYVAASATSWSLVQRSPIGCVCVIVSLIVSYLETSTLRKARPAFGCYVTEEREEIVTILRWYNNVPTSPCLAIQLELLCCLEMCILHFSIGNSA